MAGGTFGLQWHLTDACDQRCGHCYLFADGARHTDSVSWTEIRDVLANAQDLCDVLDVSPVFSLTGGDPLLHPRFWDLAALLHERGIAFHVLGNPFHLTTGQAKILAALGCEGYQVSLDGLKETHDALRRPGSYDATLAALERLKAAGLPSHVMVTVSGTNAAELPDLLRVIAQAGADHAAFARWCPADGPGDNGLTPRGYRELLVRCREVILDLKAQGFPTVFHKKDHLWTLLDFEEGRLPAPEPGAPVSDGCHCGLSHLTILPNGDVMACRRVPGSVIGNAFETRLLDLWKQAMRPYRQYDRFKACASCPLLSVCRGCPAAAAAAHGSFYAPDPQCWRAAESARS